MHPEALAWVARHATRVGDPARVLDLGGRDVNGSIRHLFPNAEYTTLDIAPGADIQADAATWVPDRAYDVVVCTEVFEHTPAWPQIVATAHTACAPGGFLITTCAGTGRARHGANGGPLPDGEHYGNVSTTALQTVLRETGWVDVTVDRVNCDTRAFATKSA